MSIEFKEESDVHWATVDNVKIGYYFKSGGAWSAVLFRSFHMRSRRDSFGTEKKAQQWLVEQIQATAK